MKRLVFTALLPGLLLISNSLLKAGDTGQQQLLSQDGNKIVTLDVRNDVPSLPIMTFFIRYPKGLLPGDQLQGVFTYLLYLTGKQNLLNWVEQPTNSDSFFSFADQHKLAVVTWTTADVYDNTDSFGQEASEEREPDSDMEQCFRTWEIGMKQLARENHLPESGYLMYGLSRGAQWAHRIVLRDPQRFIAVQIHVNSSFEEPTADAAHCLWLVTTGELEHGSTAAKIFYQKALALNYPILLRIFPGKGHEGFREETELGLKFFDYALQLKAQQVALDSQDLENAGEVMPEDKPLVLDDSLLKEFRHSPFYGDMLNGDVYPAAELAFVPASQRVGLPNLDIAKSWGYFHP